MYIKVGTTGADAGGLFCYLYGPGKKNEHTNPHMIAGNDTYPMAYPGNLGYAEARELGHTFDRVKRRAKSMELAIAGHANRGGAGHEGIDREHPHVMHVALSLHPDDKPLTDEQWATVAREYVEGMFPQQEGKAEQDWIAIRHGVSAGGNDHIHVAINLIRTDGTWQRDTAQTFVRSRNLAREIEQRHPEFLTQLVSEGERTSGTYHRVERERHPSKGRTMLPSQQLARIVRSSAMKARTESEFLMFLHDQGVSYAPRWDKGGTDNVIGYSVKLRADDNAVWHGGGKLAPDLTLTKLRERWAQDEQDEQKAVPLWRQVTRPPTRPVATDESVNRAVSQATHFMVEWTKDLQKLDPTDRAAFKREAGRLAGVFADLGQRTPGSLGVDMRWLARRYERLAQDRNRPVPPQRGNAEHAARFADTALGAMTLVRPGSWNALLAATVQAQRAHEQAERARRRHEQALAAQRQAYADLEQVRERRERIEARLAAAMRGRDALVASMQVASHRPSQVYDYQAAMREMQRYERGDSGYGR